MMDYLEKARRVLDVEIFELQRLRERLDDSFSKAVELIKASVEARGKVVEQNRLDPHEHRLAGGRA